MTRARVAGVEQDGVTPERLEPAVTA
jgi:hypothetical protein